MHNHVSWDENPPNDKGNDIANLKATQIRLHVVDLKNLKKPARLFQVEKHFYLAIPSQHSKSEIELTLLAKLDHVFFLCFH